MYLSHVFANVFIPRVYVFIPRVCKYIYDVLKNDYLTIPSSQNEWLMLAAEMYRKLNFPNGILAAESTHIGIAAADSTHIGIAAADSRHIGIAAADSTHIGIAAADSTHIGIVIPVGAGYKFFQL